MIARCGDRLTYEPASEFLRWSTGVTPQPWEPWWQFAHGGWARRALVFIRSPERMWRADGFGGPMQLELFGAE